MTGTYKYNAEINSVIVCHNPKSSFDNTAIRDFCKDHNLKLEEFNIPVMIEDHVKNCQKLFSGCITFNQKVIIPEGVDDCYGMFKDCESFNQTIHLPESIKTTMHMFENCKSFNQTVKMPGGVINSSCMFKGCETLDQPIILSNRLENSDMMFEGCKLFNQKVTLPETLRVCGRMFKGCTRFNQPITIGGNVYNCGGMFADCTALNQSVHVMSEDCFCTNMFKNCTSLRPENVTLYCKRMIRKNLEKKLRNIWGTEQIMDQTNIVTVKVSKTAKISGISCTLKGDRSLMITGEELKRLTPQEMHRKLGELYDRSELCRLEIREESAESKKTMSIYFEETLFCINFVDEWSGACYYSPKHKISEDKYLLFMVIDEFLKNGKPARMVKWKGREMGKRQKAGIIICLILVGIVGYMIGGCAHRRIWREQQEEIMAGYPDAIETYLEEKYGCEFCVAPDWTGEGGAGSPIPFMHSDYVTYKYLAWEKEEDGYAFWARVYPVSLEDKEIKEIRDNYCWKFINGKIKEELEARLEGVIDECKIIVYPFKSEKLFGGETNKDYEINEALLASEDTSHIIIRIYISPQLQFDESGSLPEIEKMVEEFYNDYFNAGSHILDFKIHETYTEEDYLKIEPEKSEQYLLDVKKSEYGDGIGDWIPVDTKTIVDISIIRGEMK